MADNGDTTEPHGSGNDSSEHDRKLPAESAVSTEHEFVTVGGERVPYRATAGTQRRRG